eukprot:2097361-Pyramimonas_sp.AAC.1
MVDDGSDENGRLLMMEDDGWRISRCSESPREGADGWWEGWIFRAAPPPSRSSLPPALEDKVTEVAVVPAALHSG